jgi:predicted Kef-type K+ transport protein
VVTTGGLYHVLAELGVLILLFEVGLKFCRLSPRLSLNARNGAQLAATSCNIGHAPTRQ